MLSWFNPSLNPPAWVQAGAEASDAEFRPDVKPLSGGSGRGRIHGADLQPRPEVFLANHYDMGTYQWEK